MKELSDVTSNEIDNGSLNLLTNCDELCHVIHIIYLDRTNMERCSGD